MRFGRGPSARIRRELCGLGGRRVGVTEAPASFRRRDDLFRDGRLDVKEFGAGFWRPEVVFFDVRLC